MTLKNKTGSEVVRGLQETFDKSGRKCRKLCSDHGKEFINKVCERFYKKHQIEKISLSQSRGKTKSFPHKFDFKIFVRQILMRNHR